MRNPWVKLAVLLLLVLVAVGALRACGVRVSDITPERIRGFVLGFGGWAPAVYVAAYGQPVIPLPASIMTAAGGLAFGVWWGTCAALAGAMTRACTQFALGRALGRDAIARLLKGRAAALDRQLGARGFLAVFLIRFIPNFPFDVQNYALASSQVRVAPYVVGTLAGIIPGVFLYALLGHTVTDPAHIWQLLAVMLLLVGVTAWLKRRRRAASHR